MKNQKTEKYTFASKIGNITVFCSNKKLTKVSLNSQEDLNVNNNPFYDDISRQINEFLFGSRKQFKIDFNLVGSSFEIEILRYICEIPYGNTLSYKEVANNAGYPNAYRAVGTVLKKNKLPLIIPCHRVIKSDGSLGDYNGGKCLKKSLIEMEQSHQID